MKPFKMHRRPKHPRLHRLMILGMLLVSPVVIPALILWDERKELRNGFSLFFNAGCRPWRYK